MVDLYCPQCGKKSWVSSNANQYLCNQCGFEYFRNIASGVVGLIVHQSQVLLIKRGKSPGAGKWGFPGGFVDVGETAIEALQRECNEEIGLQKTLNFSLFGTWPNEYLYNEVLYNTLDLYFLVELNAKPQIEPDQYETVGFKWVDIEALPTYEFAFISATNAASALYKNTNKG